MTDFQIELLWGKHSAILFQRYKSNCQLAEAGVTGVTGLEWAWLVAYKYAEIKLPEVEKSQTSETHKSGGEGRSGGRPGGNFKRPKRNQRNCDRYLTVY